MGALDTVRSWVLWWLVLFGLWIVIEGTNEAMELAAGAGAAALGATLAAVVRRQDLLAFAPEPRWLVRGWRLPYGLLYEFALVAWALVPRVTGRPSRGRWVASPFTAAGADAHSAGNRAAAQVLEDVTPNSMVAEIDRERSAALKHDLLPGHGNTVLPE